MALGTTSFQGFSPTRPYGARKALGGPDEVDLNMLRYCNKIYNRQSEVISSHKENKFKPSLTKNLFFKYFWALVWTGRTLHVAGVNVGELKASLPTSSTLFRNAPFPSFLYAYVWCSRELSWDNRENTLFISIRMNSTRSVIGYLHNSRRTVSFTSCHPGRDNTRIYLTTLGSVNQ